MLRLIGSFLLLKMKKKKWVKENKKYIAHESSSMYICFGKLENFSQIIESIDAVEAEPEW